MDSFGLGLVLNFTDNASVGLRGVHGTMEELNGLATTMSKNMDSASIAITSLISAGQGLNLIGNKLQSVGKTITDVFSTMIEKTNKIGETMSIARLQLSTMYGENGVQNYDKAEEILNQAKEYARTSIFDFESLLPSVIMLKANGIEAFDEVGQSAKGAARNILDYAADLAAFNPHMRNAYGSGVQAAIGAINEYITEGNDITFKRGTSLDITGLLNEGKGETIEERMDQVIRVMEKIGMVGTVENMVDTPFQRLSNASDMLYNLLSQIGDTVYAKYSELVAQFTDYLFDIPEEEIANFADLVGDAFSTLMTPLESVIDLVIKLADSFRDLVKEHPEIAKLVTILTGFVGVALIGVGALFKFSGSLFVFLGSIGQMIILMEKGMTIGGLFATAFKSLGSIVAHAVYSLLPFVAVAIVAYKIWNTNLNALVDDFDKAFGLIGDIVGIVMDALDSSSIYELSGENFRKMNELGIRPFIEGVMQLKYHFDRFVEGFKIGFDKIFDILGTFLEPFLGTVHSLSDIILGIVRGIGDFLNAVVGFDTNTFSAWESFGEVVGSLTAIVLIAVAAFKLVTSLIKGLTTPLGIVATAITLFAIAWGTNFLNIRDKVADFVDWFKNLDWDGITQYIYDTFEKALNNVADFFSGVVDYLASEDFATIVSHTWDGLVGIVSSAWELVKSIYELAKTVIESIFSSLGESISTDDIVNTVDGVTGFIKETIDSLTAFVQGLTDNWDSFVDGFIAGIQPIIDFVGGVVDFVIDRVNDIKNWIKSFSDTDGLDASEIADKWSGLGQTIGTFVTIATAIWGVVKVLGVLKNLAPGVTGIFGKIFSFGGNSGNGAGFLANPLDVLKSMGSIGIIIGGISIIIAAYSALSQVPGFSEFMSKGVAQLSELFIGLLPFTLGSGALVLLLGGLKALKLDVVSTLKSLGSLAEIIIGFSAIVAAYALLSLIPGFNDFVNRGIDLLVDLFEKVPGLTLGIGALSLLVKFVSSMNFSEVANGLLIVGEIIVGFSAVVGAYALLSSIPGFNDLVNKGIDVLTDLFEKIPGLTIGIGFLSLLVKVVSSMDVNSVANGLIVIGEIIVGFSAIIGAYGIIASIPGFNEFVNAGADRLNELFSKSVPLLIGTGSLALLVGALNSFHISPSVAAKGFASVVIIVGEYVGLITAAGILFSIPLFDDFVNTGIDKLNSLFIKSIPVFIGSGALGLLAAGLSALKLNPKEAAKGLADIAILTGGYTVLVTTLSGLLSNPTFSSFIDTGLDTLNTLFINSFPVFIGSGLLALLAKGLSALKLNPKDAALGLADIAILVGGFAVLIEAVGALNSIPGFENFTTVGIETLESLSESILPLVSITVALGILSKAMTKIGNPGTMATGLADIAIILGGFSVLIEAIGGLNSIPGFEDFSSIGLDTLNMLAGSIGSIVLLSGGLALLFRAITMIGEPSTYVKGLADLAIIIGGFSVLVEAIGALSSIQDFSATGLETIITLSDSLLPIIELSGGLTLLLAAVSKLTNPKAIASGLADIAIAIGGFDALITAIGAISSIPGDFFTNGISTMQVLSDSLLAIITLAGSLTLLSSAVAKITNPKQVAEGLADIAIALGGFSALIAAIGALTSLPEFSDFMTNGVTNLSVIADSFDSIGILTGALSLLTVGLSKLTNPKQVAEGLADIAIVLGGFEALIIAMGALTSIPGFDDFLSNGVTNISSLSKAMTVFSSPEFLTMASAMVALGAIGPATVASGLGGLAIILGGFEAIIVAFAALKAIPGFEDFAAGGAELLTGLFNTIGTAVGSLIGGFGEGLTDSLPQIGANLAGFAEQVTPFFEMCSNASDIDVEGVVGALTAFVVGMAASEFLSFFSGGLDLVGIGAQLSGFSTNVAGFFESCAGLSPEGISNAKGVFEALGNLDSSAFKSGGFFEIFTGSLDLGNIAEQLKTFAENGKAFFDACADMSTDGIANAKLVFESLGGIGNIDFKTGGLWQAIVGETDFGKIAEQLATFAEKGKSFFEMAAGLDEEGLNKAPLVFQALGGIGNVDFKTGGLWQAIIGETDFARIGTQLASFAENGKTFFNACADYSESGIEKAPQVFSALSGIGSYDFKTDGLFQLFTGTTNLVSLGSQLASFAPNAKIFFTMLEGVTESCIKKTGDLFKALSDLSTCDFKTDGLFQLFTGTVDLAKVGTQLSSFATNAKGFFESASSWGDSVSTATQVVNMLSVLGTIPDLNTGSLADISSGTINLSLIGEQLAAFGTQAQSFFSSISGVTKATIINGKSVLSILEEISTIEFPSITDLVSAAELTENLTAIGAGAKSFFTEISGIPEGSVEIATGTITAFKDDITTLIGIHTSLTGVDLVAMGEDLVSFIGKVKDFISQASAIGDSGGTSSIVTVLSPFFNLVAEFDGSKLTVIATGMTELGTAIVTFSEDILSFRTDVETDIKSVVDTFSGMSTSISDSLTSASSTVDSKLSGISSTLSTKLSEISGTISTNLIDISDTVNIELYGISEDVTNGLTTISDTVSAELTEISSTINTELTNMNSIVTDGLSAINSSVITGKNNISASFSSLITSISNDISSLVSKFNDLKTQSLDALNGIAKSASGIGSDIMSNMASGIANSVGLVKSALKNALKGVKIEIPAVTVSTESKKGKGDSSKGSSLQGLSTGGYIKTTGIAILHPNEVVVNDSTTKRLQNFLNVFESGLESKRFNSSADRPVLVSNTVYPTVLESIPVAPVEVSAISPAGQTNTTTSNISNITRTITNNTYNNSTNSTPTEVNNDYGVTFEKGSIVIQIENASNENLEKVADKLMKIIARKQQLKGMTVR